MITEILICPAEGDFTPRVSHGGSHAYEGFLKISKKSRIFPKYFNYFFSLTSRAKYSIGHHSKKVKNYFKEFQSISKASKDS